MILNKISTRVFIANLLADFLMSKLGKKNDSIIEVIDCRNFFVLKGKTISKEILDIPNSLKEFENNYKSVLSDKLITHTIDLIEYDCKLDKVFELELVLHNSENCSFSPIQMDFYDQNNCSVYLNFVPFKINENELSLKSHFPFGYSLNQGRLLYFYLKKMFYSIPTNYTVNSLFLKINLSKKDENILKISNPLTFEEDEILKSAFLDSLDFNTKKLEKEIENLDWSYELLNPKKDLEELKNNNFEIVII